MKITTQDLLSAIADNKNNQARIVTLYSIALESMGKRGIEWAFVDAAIAKRWSNTAVKTIQKKAWSVMC